MLKRFKSSISSTQILSISKGIKKIRKILATIIVLSIIIEALPINAVFANTEEIVYNNEIQTNLKTYEEFEGTIDDTYNSEDVRIVEEIVSKRTANSKTFLKSDGSFEMYYYEDTIHYQDQDGNWIEIDNSLEDLGSSFTNTNNSYEIYLPKTLSEETSIQFAIDEYQISWSIKNINSSVLYNIDDNTSSAFTQNVNEYVIYNQIFQNVNLEYILKSSEVKENIILTEYKDNFSVSLEYSLVGLELSYNEEGRLCFVNSNNKVVFYFEDLYMYDSNFSESSSVLLQYEQIGEDTYVITITPDDDWLQQAEYPVVIDPSIELTTSNSTLSYKSVSNNGATSSFLKIGNDDDVISRSYINLPIEIIPENTVLTYAHLNLDITINDENNDNPLLLYEVEDIAFEYINTFSNNFATYNVIDYGVINEDTPDTIHFDISSIYQKWYSEGLTYGILEFRFFDETLSWWDSLWNLSRAIEAIPSIVVGYRETIGLYDYMTYNSQEIGYSNVGYVQDYSGQLTVYRNDFNFASELQTLSLNMYHNQKDKAINIGYGYGWRSEYNIEVSFDDDLDQFYTKDGSGSIVYYTNPIVSGSSTSYSTTEYTAEDGTQTKLIVSKYIDSIISLSLVTIDQVSFNFTTTMVSSSFLLSSISNETSDLSITINYISSTSKSISNVVDSSGNRIVLTYVSGLVDYATLELYQPDGTYNVIEEIDYSYFSYIQITYVSGFILCEDGSIMITMVPQEEVINTKFLDNISYFKNYNNNTTLILDYSVSYVNSIESKNILRISDTTGDKIYYTYNSNNQVDEISRYYKNIRQGSVLYDFSLRTTKIEDLDTEDYVQYNFDIFGHTILITNNDGESHSYRYMNLFSENDINSSTNSYTLNYNQNHKMIYDSGQLEDDLNDAVFSSGSTYPIILYGDYSEKTTTGYNLEELIVRNQGYTLSAWSIFNGTPLTISSEYDRVYQVSIEFEISTLTGIETYSETIVYDSSLFMAQRQSKSFIVPSNMISATLKLEYQGWGSVEFFDVAITEGMVGTAYSLNEEGYYSGVTENYQTTTIEYNTNTTYVDGTNTINFDDIVTVTKPDGTSESMSYSDLYDLYDYNNVKVLTTYNSDGQAISSKSTLNSISFTKTISYSSINNNQYLNSITDYKGNTTNYDYDSLTGLLNSVNSANDATINYEYYSDGALYRVSVGDNCDTSYTCHETTYIYDESSDLLTGIILENGYSYQIQYDSYERIESISIENGEYSNTLIQYSYINDDGRYTNNIY